MKLKECPKCGRVLTENDFTPNSPHCKLCKRDYDWQYSYGLSPEQYLELHNSQEGKCKICGKELDSGYLHVDHDKNTGEIRGLLCGNCNRGLGLFGDSIKNLEKAVEYLKCQEQ